MTHRFSIIVPVHNESACLIRTIPFLLDGLPDDALVIYVCNGCVDDSASVIKQCAGNRAIIIETNYAGKPNAIRVGEQAAGDCFPRFFVDADILVQGSVFCVLANDLANLQLEMVSPTTVLDTDGCSFAARCIAQTWSGLPFMKECAFRTVIGVSRQGRARWQELPDLIADDTYMALQVPAERRKIIHTVTMTERVPRTFWSYAGVRARWLMGDWELKERGASLYGASQRPAVLKLLQNQRTFIPAAIYLVNRMLAVAIATWWRWQKSKRWYRDDTSRKT